MRCSHSNMHVYMIWLKIAPSVIFNNEPAIINWQHIANEIIVIFYPFWYWSNGKRQDYVQIKENTKVLCKIIKQCLRRENKVNKIKVLSFCETFDLCKYISTNIIQNNDNKNYPAVDTKFHCFDSPSASVRELDFKGNGLLSSTTKHLNLTHFKAQK